MTVPTLLERFASTARRLPAAPAVSHRSRTMTYGELDRRSSELAGLLAGAGVGTDDVVAVSVERSFDMAVAVLATLKAGAGYLPLDPAYPADRLGFMLEDSRAKVVLTQAAIARRLPETGAPRWHLDDRATWPGPERARRPAADPGPEHLAYAIYTSGSTGKPKGVAMVHGALANLVDWQLRDSRVGEGKKTLQFAPLSFDVSFQEMFGTWAAGGTLVLVDEEMRLDAVRLLELIRQEGVARLFLPFVALQSLCDIAVEHDLVPRCLEEVITAGEQLQVTKAVVAFFRALPTCSLHNHYGPSETHVVTAFTLRGDPGKWPALPPIGTPIQGTEAAVLDEARRPVADGQEGELYLGGECLARGYLHRPELTAERFVEVSGRRWYRTGDLCKRIDAGELAGNLQFLGRIDGQVKVRGYRIELGEVEVAISRHPGVRQAAATVREDRPGDRRLVGYLACEGDPRKVIDEVRRDLEASLPEYMVPGAFVALPELPRTPSGKVDRRALPAPGKERPELGTELVAPRSPTELAVAAIFEDLLDLRGIGVRDGFFELGGNSLLALRAVARMRAQLGIELSIVDFLEKPTIGAVAERRDRDRSPEEAPVGAPRRRRVEGSGAVAIVGMAGRFPGARNVAELWSNLLAGKDTTRFFAPEELDPGLDPAAVADPAYVRARGVLDDADLFDAGFFGFNPNEALALDPQQRLLLELAWQALEDAGYRPDRTGLVTGVYCGTHNNSYRELLPGHPEIAERIGEFTVMTASEKDYVATRIASKLDLTGPALSVHTACSTGLVSVVVAVQHLRAGLCDLALAGGASVSVPRNAGHLYLEGGMLSRDGRCRPFDADASGTTFSDGAGLVALRRLEDAVASGDRIHAVIRGIGINNDGADKASFTAPSVKGQAAAIAMAHDDGDVDPRSIGYLEAHGTATPLGDPIEVEALTRAFRRKTDARQFCKLGSVKSNFGHLTAAAGVAGLIKAALCVREGHIPPSLHFERPNPKIDFERTPFVVAARGEAWSNEGGPRRAGVSAFGVGGTNAHVVVEQPPRPRDPGPSIGPQLLLVSGKTEAALARNAEALAAAVGAPGAPALADVSYSSKRRGELRHRQFAVASSAAEATAALRAPRPPHARAGASDGRPRPVVFMFPGQGSQHVDMGRTLHGTELAFRLAVDECAGLLQPHLGRDLRDLLYPAPGAEAAASEALRQTENTQVALFTVEYALAAVWRRWGVEPAAMAGHSIGEFVAATLAGIMPLSAALALVARRGRLMQALPPGAMLSVRAGAGRIAGRLPPGVDLASENAPDLCVVSGPAEAIQAFARTLESEGIAARALVTSHAFHSAMMEPAVARFREACAEVKLSAPRIPIVSTRTGTWLTAEEAQDPGYWAGQLRDPVRFGAAVATLWEDEDRILLEVGPRQTLTALAYRQARGARAGGRRAVASLPDGATGDAEWTQMLTACGELWLGGVSIDWSRFHENESRQHVSLPGYAFEPTRFWLEPKTTRKIAGPQPERPAEVTVMSDRKPRLASELRELFEAASGMELSAEDAGVRFLELGFDSLLLTQIALKLKQKYRIDVTFRQLMEQVPTLESLVEHLDQALPPEQPAPAPAAAQVAPPAPGTTGVEMLRQALQHPAVAGDDVVQSLVRQQLAVMQQQLALLAGRPLAAPALAPTPAPARDDDEVARPQKYDVKKAFGAIARIHLDGPSVDDHQRRALEAIVQRYTRKTAGSKKHTQEYRKAHADPRVVSGFRPQVKELVYPIVTERSKGSRLWDIDGNEYIDALNGFGSNFFGHAADFIQEALRAQIDRGFEIGPQTALASESARLACELTGLDRAAFCNTGSEAVMGTMRIARTVTGRTTIAAFSGSYHGIFDEVLVRGTRKHAAIPAAPGIMPEAVQNMLILDYGTEESLRIIRERAGDLAAVLVEPVQSRRPDFQPREFLQEVRRITEASRTALIFDEVITGFRSHPGGAQHLFGVRADLASYGKAPGGGMPLGMIAGRSEWMDALDGGHWQFGDASAPTAGVTYFAGTFVRHPLTMAAARASLERMKKEGPALQQGINARTARMAGAINAVCKEAGAPIEIRHFASLWKTFYLEEQSFGDLLFVLLRERGIHIWDGFPCFLSAAHTDADVDAIVNAYREAVREMQSSGFLPRRPQQRSQANLDAGKPPAPGARLGRTPSGDPAWFVPDPDRPGKYRQLDP